MRNVVPKASVIDRGELDFEDDRTEQAADHVTYHVADYFASERPLRPYLIRLGIGLVVAFLFGAYGLRPLLHVGLAWLRSLLEGR